MRRSFGVLPVVGFVLGLALALGSPSCSCGGPDPECDGGTCPPQTGPDGCVRQTCAQLGAECGGIFNGCEIVSNCGTCTPPTSCAANGTPNRCSCVPGRWSSVAVDSVGSVGGSPSLAVDSAGNLHVSYRDTTNQALKYAFRPAGSASWTSERVADAGDVGTDSSIAVDGAGTVHVSYLDRTNQDVRYAWRPASGAWSSEVVDPIGAGGTSIAVDGVGTVHVAYRSSTGLQYARKPPGGAWAREQVDIYVVGQTAIAIGPDGQARLAYTAGFGTTQARFAQRLDAGVYAMEVVDHGDSGYVVAPAVSLAVEPGGGVHVGHWRNFILVDPQQQSVLHSVRPSGGGWSTEAVDTRNRELGPFGVSLALDAAGQVHLAFADSFSSDLRYTVRSTGGVWSAPVLVDYVGDVGNTPSLALSSAGPHVVYQDSTNQDLRAADRCP